MTDLVQSLFRIDPTQGLVDYVSSIKPYHTKVLDVLVEYVYSESIVATVTDNFNWEINLHTPTRDIVRTCSYGTVWDMFTLETSNPSVNLVKAQSIDSFKVSTINGSDLSISSVGTNLETGTRVTVSTSTNFPTSNPQLKVGEIYVVNGHNGSFYLTEESTNTVVHFSGDYVEFSINPVDIKFNTFLVEPNYGPVYSVAVTNTISNQLTFATSYQLVQAIPQQHQFIVNTKIQPQFAIINITYDNILETPLAQAGNCNFVISGNHADLFQPNDTFNVISSTGNNKTYTVSASNSGRTLTRFDGKNTYIPVNENIPINVADGFVQLPVTSLLYPGLHITITGDSGTGGNGSFTVSNVQIVNNQTVITVTENMSLMTVGDGTVHIPSPLSDIPIWPDGLQVRFVTTGIFPSPINQNDTYYFVLTSTPGVFNIAKKPYPTELSDYIDFTSVGTGPLYIQRAEIFHAGDSVTVRGSYLNKNDQTYTIRSSSVEGDYVRLYVMERVGCTTPLSQQYDGIVSFNFGGYDTPAYCPASSSPDMFADSYIHEHVSFEFSINLNDEIHSTVTSGQPTGYGVMPYGDLNQPYGTFGDTRTFATTGITSHTILPHGFDAQFYDVGLFADDIDVCGINYTKPFYL